jgi:hypothetical protein
LVFGELHLIFWDFGEFDGTFVSFELFGVEFSLIFGDCLIFWFLDFRSFDVDSVDFESFGLCCLLEFELFGDAIFKID